MPLKEIKVIELGGLAPGPYAGMVLTEFGATVLRVDKVNSSTHVGQCLSNGKASIALNLKDPVGVKILRDLCKKSDVLIDPFRAGVMEKLGLGPDILMKDNPRLIYARLTGFGQSGPYSNKGGHEINFLALSGLLSLYGKPGTKPIMPVGVGADFGGGGLTCAFGIILALFERNRSGRGQVIDSNIVEGTAYLGSLLYRFVKEQVPVSHDLHYYDTYETKDGKHMTVGAVEPQFYSKVVQGLGLDEHKVPQKGDISKFKKIFEERFLEKTQKEWCDIFDRLDACVVPVVTLEDAGDHPHHIARQSFLKDGDLFVPNTHPVLSRTPGKSAIFKSRPQIGEHTKPILKSMGFGEDSVSKLIRNGTVQCTNSK